LLNRNNILDECFNGRLLDEFVDDPTLSHAVKRRLGEVEW
jgi:hypothetical protein